MSEKASQVDRIIKAARSYKGISRIDFQLPDVIDGGDPILNFPGRMFDAEKRGCVFEKIGRRNRCSVWRLVSEGEGSTGTLGDQTSPVAGEHLTDSPTTPGPIRVKPGTVDAPSVPVDPSEPQLVEQESLFPAPRMASPHYGEAAA